MAKAKKGKLTIEDALVPVEDQPYEIPENWCWTKLAPIVNIQTGKKDANYGCDDGEYYFFTCASEPIRCADYSYDCKAVLLAGNGDISNISIYEGKFEAYQRTYIVEAQNNILTEFLYYYFKYRWVDYNIDKMFGTAIPYIRLGNLNDFEIPIPPIEEQKRIVEQIETLFSKLDAAKDNSQVIIEEILVNKQALLFKAFEGSLTKKWRKDNGCSEGWEKKLLIDVLTEKPRNGYSPKPVDYPTPYKSMTLSATTSGVFKPEFYKYIDEKIEEDSYLWLKQGDILIQRANSLEKVGTSAIYTGGEHEFIYPDLIMKLQVKEGVLPEFICYQLKTEKTMEYFRRNATGTAGNMPKINQKIVSNVEIMLPSEDEQKEIVSILNRMYERYDSIIENTQMTIDKIDDVKKTILYKAFRGELGTNIADEESSIELLRQILE